ncbi:hypothetical protein HK102_013860 [Quaeritorhiza haematococci]|nr:hypothetical protein HK102_013860 [Quaeritorhiza haematococci]
MTEATTLQCKRINSSHSLPGHTDLMVSPHDGFARRSAVDDKDADAASSAYVDAEMLDEHYSAVTSVALWKDKIVTGSDDHSAALFTFSLNNSTRSAKFEKTLVRTTLPVRHVAFASDGMRVAVASDDATIKLVDIEDITKSESLKGHDRGVKSLAFDPAGDFLLSAGSEGNIRVWNLREDPPMCVKVIEDICVAAEPEEPELCRLSWHPSGDRVAVPGPSRDIVILQRRNWEPAYTFDAEVNSNVSAVSWSPNGVYLACIGVRKELAVWRLGQDKSQKELVTRYEHTCRITGLSWHPKENELYFADENGNLFYTPEAVPIKARPSLPHPAQEATPSKTSTYRADAPNPKTGSLAQFKPSAAAKALESKIFGDNSRDKKALDSPSATKQQQARKKSGGALGGGINLSDDEEDNGFNDDDFVVDDDGAGYAEALERPDQFRRYEEKNKRKVASSLTREREMDLSRGFRFEGTEIQSAFQPGATPQKGNRRTLAFNLLGYIYTIEQPTHSTVHVEFHDKSQRAVHFTDHYNYSLACLGEHGALFACESTHNSPSTIHFRPFDTWASKNDWLIQLNPGENAKAVALTSRGAVVATDQRFLRFFSHGGVQNGIRCLSGPIVAMTAWGDLLMVVQHGGGTYHGEQNLIYMLIDLEQKQTIRSEGLPISPGSVLEWIGFSENGMPLNFDSSGALRILLRHDDYQWIPIFDSRQARGAKQEHYWPVGLANNSFMCVVCKGGDKHPLMPASLITELPLQVPFASMDNQSSVLEEKLFRLRVLYEHERGELQRKKQFDDRAPDVLRRKAEMDKTILQLIQMSTKADKNQRAMDLCSNLNMMKSIDGAVKIALHHHLPSLAERMNLIKESRHRQGQEERQKELESTKHSWNPSRSYDYEDSTSFLAPNHSSNSGSSSIFGSGAGRSSKSKRKSSSSAFDDDDVMMIEDDSHAREAYENDNYGNEDLNRSRDGSDDEMKVEKKAKPQAKSKSTPIAASRGSTSSKSRNPFAVNDAKKGKTDAKRASSLMDGDEDVSIGKHLFNAIQGITKTHDAPGKTASAISAPATTENPKKRKAQTTLGFSKKTSSEDVDTPDEKKAKSKKTKTPISTSDDQPAAQNKSIMDFLSTNSKETAKPGEDSPGKPEGGQEVADGEIEHVAQAKDDEDMQDDQENDDSAANAQKIQETTEGKDIDNAKTATKGVKAGNKLAAFRFKK